MAFVSLGYLTQDILQLHPVTCKFYEFIFFAAENNAIEYQDGDFIILSSPIEHIDSFHLVTVFNKWQ